MSVSALTVRDPLDVRVPDGLLNEGLPLATYVDEPEGWRWLAWALRQPIGFWDERFEAALYIAALERDRRWRRRSKAAA
jgi:hypothetical protein